MLNVHGLAIVGTDPELAYTKNSTPVLKFRAAFKNGYKREDTSTWVSVAVFGKSAEGLAKFLAKRMRVYIVGTLEAREYESKTYLDVKASGVEVVTRPQEKEKPKEDARDDTEDDLPF